MTRSWLHRYGIALLAAELALLLMVLVQTLIPLKGSPFVLCFAAVMVSAWYGGLGPALLVTTLATLAGTYFYLPPVYSLAIAPDDMVRLGLFMLEEVAIVSLVGALQFTKRRAEISAVKLRASEERYRRIIDTAYEGIWTINAEVRTSYVNQQMAEMLGYTVEEMLGCPLDDFMHEADRSKAKRNFERSKQGIKQQYDFWFRHKDGSVVLVIGSISPIVSENGEFLGALGMFMDVTERQQALALVRTNADLERNERQLQAKVRQLQQQNEQLEEVSRLKSEFLIDMSHELRTPLTSIMGFSSVLLQQVFGPLTVKQQEYLSLIHTSGEHLLGLINHLLDLAKIKAGKMVLNIEAVDLAALCRDALQMIQVRALAKHQHLSLELPIAIKSITVDRQRILQILLNYLSNAVKFTPEGGTLTLSTRLSSGLELEAQTVGVIERSSPSASSPPCFVVLSVSDTGIGIPCEKQHLLFQTFEQMEESNDRQDMGTGLGLALTRRLAELHGGTVSFTSTPGVGSTFSVWLPL